MTFSERGFCPTCGVIDGKVVKSPPMPPPVPGWGEVGANFDRCIMHLWQCHAPPSYHMWGYFLMVVACPATPRAEHKSQILLCDSYRTLGLHIELEWLMHFLERPLSKRLTPSANGRSNAARLPGVW